MKVYWPPNGAKHVPMPCCTIPDGNRDAEDSFGFVERGTPSHIHTECGGRAGLDVWRKLAIAVLYNGMGKARRVHSRHDLQAIQD